jgi:hypothetical protein
LRTANSVRLAIRRRRVEAVLADDGQTAPL